MLVRQEKIAIILLFLVSVVLVASCIILDDLGRATFATEFSSDSPEGSLVAHSGTVDRMDSTRTGGHLILDVSGVPVFIPEQAAREIKIVTGDSVTVYGTVRMYRGEKEIVVEYADDISTI
ncbi:MAG: hypothetical protein PHR63_10620 [Methanoregulaceae archaeon]|jgi:hypothetical protein|nr:hypothetical protein [Methanoregulaceae archaeon]MDD5686184.1 hypothetical protein [Methanoregulaceae archaeon]